MEGLLGVKKQERTQRFEFQDGNRLRRQISQMELLLLDLELLHAYKRLYYRKECFVAVNNKEVMGRDLVNEVLNSPRTEKAPVSARRMNSIDL